MAVGKAQNYWIVKQHDTLSGIAKHAFQLGTPQSIARKVTELAALNRHITNPNRIYPGQPIYLGTEGGFPEPVYENDLRQAEAMLRAMPPDRLAFTVENWTTLQVISDEMRAPTGPSFISDTSMKPRDVQGMCGSESCYVVADSFSKIMGPASDIGEVGFLTYAKAANGKFGNLLNKHVWSKVQGELMRSFADKVRYVSQENGALRLIPRGSRALESAGKVIIVNGNAGGIRAFSEQVRHFEKIGEKLHGVGGKVCFWIDVGLGAYEVHKKWDTPERVETVFEESGKLAGKAAGGALATGAATTVCGTLTLTTGPLGVGCFFTVGLATVLGGSYLGGKIGSGAYHIIEKAATLPYSPATGLLYYTP